MGQEDKSNKILIKDVPIVYSFLSKLGRRIYFPSAGILAQSAEAKSANINASIGIALDDSKGPLCLEGVSSKILLDKNLIFPYASSFGITKLREIWKSKILLKNKSLSKNNITLPVITTGLTHALFVCAQMFCDEATEILLPDLYWGNYNLIFEVNNQSKFVKFNFFKDDKFNINGLKEELFSRNKAIVLLNFPNNPTGYSLTEQEQNQLVELFLNYAKEGNSALVICDDAYFGLFYESDVAKESLFTKLAGLHENIVSVKIDGPTKEEYVWGLRVGSIVVGNKMMTLVAAKAIEDKFAGLVRSSISNVSLLSQNLLISGFESESYLDEKKVAFDLLQSRYLAVKNYLLNDQRHHKFFEVLPFNSGYFMCVKLKKEFDCEKIRVILLREHSIGLISISSSNFLRIAYSCLRVDEVSKIFDALILVCKECEK